jgi:hypothetical protein
MLLRSFGAKLYESEKKAGGLGSAGRRGDALCCDGRADELGRREVGRFPAADRSMDTRSSCRVTFTESEVREASDGTGVALCARRLGGGPDFGGTGTPCGSSVVRCLVRSVAVGRPPHRLVHRGGAAARLSQPTVTAQIRTLEQQTGRTLFTRLPRGVEPTPLAHEPAGQVAAPLDALAALEGGSGPPAGRGAPVHLADPRELLCVRVLPAPVPSWPTVCNCASPRDAGRLVLLHDPEEPPLNTLFLVRRPGADTDPDVTRVREALQLAARAW